MPGQKTGNLFKLPVRSCKENLRIVVEMGEQRGGKARRKLQVGQMKPGAQNIPGSGNCRGCFIRRCRRVFCRCLGGIRQSHCNRRAFLSASLAAALSTTLTTTTNARIPK